MVRSFPNFAARATLPLWLAAVLLCAASARGDGFDADAEFARAREAFDARDFAGAIARYEAILAAGYDAPELRYNLGNARFGAGDAPGAVREYLIAARARPRDPDIAKNLAYVIEKAGAVRPTLSFARAAVRRWTEGEWRALAAVAWGVAMLALAASFVAPRGRAPLRRVALAAALTAALGVLGAMEWRGLARHPEAVVARADAAARFAPLESATVHFTLPAGSIVRVVGRDGAWRRVALDGREGWLPESDLLLVP